MNTADLTSKISIVDFWRSLRYFNFYRLALAILFAVLAGVFGTSISLGEHDRTLFFVASLIYLAAVLLSFVPLLLRWLYFSWQLAFQVGTDIVALTVLSHASGGIASNVGLLLLVSLAAAGMISRGRITLFFAALASIATLTEHLYAVLTDGAEVALFFQVGFLCIAYFAVAWLAHRLAKYAVDSEELAQRRGRELVNLAEANRLVMRDMQDGVLVVDGRGAIIQLNPGAERMLRSSAVQGSLLSESFPVLFERYKQWKQTGIENRGSQELDAGVQARLRFVAIGRNIGRGTVIFLEDMQRVRAEAQQIKLAALGRLTANIAHEVRNPLSAISYAAELIQEEGEGGGEGNPRLLQIVLDNTQRINQIVQDVMQLNRRDRAQPEVFELDGMLRTFAHEFSLAERLDTGVLAVVGIQGAEVEFDRGQLRRLPAGESAGKQVPATKVSFDRGHLRQVLWNLCRNAARYGRGLPGSLLLVVSAAGGRYTLTVQDDGPGIPAEHQGKLFEPFFTTATDGTGLGLYIAKELCEANGAQLEYHGGGRRQGARFRIVFSTNPENSGEH